MVGPLLKKQYIEAINGFQVWKAFPDYDMGAFGFSIDPCDPMRVWFFSRSTGTMTNDWQMMGTTLKATNKPIQNGIEALSMIWTPERKVKCAPCKLAWGTSSFRVLMNPRNAHCHRSPTLLTWYLFQVLSCLWSTSTRPRGECVSRPLERSGAARLQQVPRKLKLQVFAPPPHGEHICV